MKNIFYLIVFLATLYATFAHAQLSDITLKSQTVDGKTITTIDSVKKIWGNRVEINPTHGQTYDWRLGSDTAHYFHPVNGKYFRARVTFYDATIGFPGGTTPPPTDDTTKVDAQEATFAGTWIRGITPAPGWYKKTIAFSNATGATMTYNFTGTNIQFWAERRSTHGSGTITITQGTTIIKSSPVNFNVAPYGLPVLIFDSGPVPRGNYTLTLKVGSGYNLADFFIVKQ